MHRLYLDPQEDVSTLTYCVDVYPFEDIESNIEKFDEPGVTESGEYIYDEIEIKNAKELYENIENITSRYDGDYHWDYTLDQYDWEEVIEKLKKNKYTRKLGKELEKKLDEFFKTDFDEEEEDES